MSRRPKRKRAHVPLIEKLASALADTLPAGERDAMRDAKVPALTVVRLFTPDHNHLHAFGGSDKWWNLTMRRRGPALKAKDSRDTSIVAKSDRLVESEAVHRATLLRLGFTGDAAVDRARSQASFNKVMNTWLGKRRSRAFPKGRKLQSRGFQQRAP